MSDPMNAIETELAKAIVQAMVGGLVELVKKVPALFGRASKIKQQHAAAEIERSSAALTTAAGADRDRETIRQEATWETLLRGLLAEHRDVSDAMYVLLTELQHGLPSQDSTTQVVVVSGGSAYAAQHGDVIHHQYAPPLATGSGSGGTDDEVLGR